jgi:hypothetical protein
VAYAQITHVFPDGSRVTVRTGTDRGDGAYPDQLAELNARLLDLYRATVVDVDPNNAE